MLFMVRLPDKQWSIPMTTGVKSCHTPGSGCCWQFTCWPLFCQGRPETAASADKVVPSHDAGAASFERTRCPGNLIARHTKHLCRLDLWSMVERSGECGVWRSAAFKEREEKSNSIPQQRRHTAARIPRSGGSLLLLLL